MNDAERHARKQVLLTRIAFQRQELQREITQLRQASEPRRLLRGLIGESPSNLLRGLFGRGAPSGDLLTQALGWLRRYRMAAALVGGAAPLLRGGGRWRRLLRIAAVAGASWLGWSALRNTPSMRPAAPRRPADPAATVRR